MLSRVADSLYWMARYIERAGNVARLVEANSSLELDSTTSQRADSLAFWRPVLEATALVDAYNEAVAERPELTIPDFLMLDPKNPDSIVASVSEARENARMVRDQISSEMWLELNTLHLFLKSQGAAEWTSRPEDFFARIIRFSLLFQGITDATVPQNEGWHFIQAGICLERADKTSRILDIPHRVQGARSAAPWGTVLGSCSAGPAYRDLYGDAVDEWKVTNLLIFSDSFPRSVRFCLRRLNEVLHAISGTPQGQYSNEAERLTGSALAGLDFADPNDVAQAGLSAYVDQLQRNFNEISQKIFETYVLLPSELQSLNIDSRYVHAYNQQQQQQQQ
ncbi:MAG: alpha-E domain-containing protein [Verrucomicrobiales bacterium]|nr:alpha-E domain-containing protein [Verrucomicrobiales bacterium]